MKKLFTLLLALLFIIQSNAQEIKRAIFDNTLATPKILVLDENQKINTTEGIDFLKSTLKFDQNEDFRIIKKNTYGDREVIKLQHSVNDIDVFGSVYIIHSENGFVKKFNGKYYSNINTITPQLTAKNSIDFALKYFNATEYFWENSFEEELIKKLKNDESATHYPDPKLNYYQFNEEMLLCYQMDIYSSKPVKAEKIFIDATTGKIINTISLLHDVDQEAVGISKYSDTVHIMTSEDSPGVYSLNDYTRGGGVITQSMNSSTNYADAVDLIHNDTIWDITNANRDEVAIDAHWGAEVTYDYFLEQHNRDSYDDNGSQLWSLVHYDVNWSNASWNGFSMRYGDGSPGGNPYIGLDIVGHEISHGVTGNSAGLIYQGESGALNESFSDIFGNSIEHFSDSNRSEWLVGEQCFNQLRNMSNPNSFGDPDTYDGISWANTAPSAFDNGGVHINSGVQNFWYYLLVEGGTGTNDNGDTYNVTPMGWDVASEIAYRNLNEYLGQSSDYMDARDFSYEVAADIFGDCSDEAKNVIEAWYAVGVGSRLDADVNPNFLLNFSYACNLPLDINFQNLTQEEAYFAWDFGDGNASLNDNPFNSYAQEGEYDITLTADLSNTCYTSTNSITKTLQVVELGTPLTPTCQPPVLTSSNSLGTQSVSLNGLYYDSGMDDDDYNDYTCKTNTILHIDSTYQITVNTSLSTSQNVRVWIDYNNDGEFTDDELILISNAKIGEHTASVNFAGINPVMGATPLRMRVVSDILFNNDISSCGELRFGQTEDYSVLFVNGDGTINNIKSDKLGFNVYPNPAKNVLNVQLSNIGDVNYQIVDLAGKSIISNKLESNIIDINNIDKGLYFITFYSNDKIETIKFTKE